MKEYLSGRTGDKIGILRVGMPKEVFFEATVKEVSGNVVILEIENGKETVLSIDKIIYVGSKGEIQDEAKKVGFTP